MNTAVQYSMQPPISTSSCLCRIQSASVLKCYRMFYMDVVAPENVFLWRGYPAALVTRMANIWSIFVYDLLDVCILVTVYPSICRNEKCVSGIFQLQNPFYTIHNIQTISYFHQVCLSFIDITTCVLETDLSMNQLDHIRFLISVGSHTPSPKEALLFLRRTNTPSPL